MPDGFSSVADLRVIVDSNADAFHRGVQGVMSVLDGLGAKGNDSLGGLDKIMGMVGDTAIGFRGKFNLAMSAVESGVALYQRLAQEGRAVAEALGATEEYDKLKASIDDLGMSLQDAAVGAFFAVQSAGMNTASAMLGFADATAVGDEQARGFAATLIEKVAKALDDVNDRMRILNVGMSQSSTEVDGAVAALDRRIKKIQEEIATLEEANRVADQEGDWWRRIWNPYSGEIHLAKMKEDIAGLRALKEEMKALSDNLPTRTWKESTQVHTSLLNDEIAALDRRIAVLGMSSGAAAEYNAFQKAMNEAARQGLELSDEQIAFHQREAAEIGRKTQAIENFAKAEAERQRAEQLAAQRARAEGQIFANAEREISTLRMRADALGLNAREAAELAMQERLLQQLRASGNTVTEAEVIKIRALAAEYGKMTETLAEQQEMLRDLGQTGQIIAGGLASEFSKWTRGAEIDVKNMVANILAELAQLTLRRSVLEPLFGGSSGGGGLVGDLIGGIFGGYRADGGDVSAGRSYVVGERGPELFIPSQNGTIVPNEATRGGQGGRIDVFVHGTPEFDARVRSTAEGVVVQRAPEIVGRSVEAVQDYRERTGLD